MKRDMETGKMRGEGGKGGWGVGDGGWGGERSVLQMEVEEGGRERSVYEHPQTCPLSDIQAKASRALGSEKKEKWHKKTWRGIQSERERKRVRQTKREGHQLSM